MSEIYSAKWVYGIGTFITALLTLVTPMAAKWHVGVLIFIRALEGLAQVSKSSAINVCFLNFFYTLARAKVIYYNSK